VVWGNARAGIASTNESAILSREFFIGFPFKFVTKIEDVQG
jgi:hypothetical protein